MTEAFMGEVAAALAFLLERFDYTLASGREPSACHAAPFHVLTYTNRERDRRLELHVQFANDWIHYHAR